MSNITFKGVEEKPFTISGNYFGANYTYTLPMDADTTEFFRTVLAAYATEGYQNGVEVKVYRPAVPTFNMPEEVTTLTFHPNEGISIDRRGLVDSE